VTVPTPADIGGQSYTHTDQGFSWSAADGDRCRPAGNDQGIDVPSMPGPADLGMTSADQGSISGWAFTPVRRWVPVSLSA
jgi:hypothetical protein